MKKKLVWRYYCEYCKVSKGTKCAIDRHEERCTSNPNRRCGLCAMVNGGYGYVMELCEILSPYRLHGDVDYQDRTLLPKDICEKLREVSENCPTCIFSALKQSGLQSWQLEGFDYEKEQKQAFEDAMHAIHEERMSIVGMPYCD